MTVNELIEELKKYDGEIEVKVEGAGLESIFLGVNGEVHIISRNKAYNEESITLRGILCNCNSPVEIFTGKGSNADIKWCEPDISLPRPMLSSLSNEILDEEISAIEARHDVIQIKVPNDYR